MKINLALKHTCKQLQPSINENLYTCKHTQIRLHTHLYVPKRRVHVGRNASAAKMKAIFWRQIKGKGAIVSVVYWKLCHPSGNMSTLAKSHHCPRPGKVVTSKRIKLKRRRPCNGMIHTSLENRVRQTGIWVMRRFACKSN